MKKTLIALSMLGLLSATAHAGDADKGKEKSAVCAACHGADGNSVSPDFPRLAGQYEDYLFRALQDYKSGARKNPIMQGQVAALEKADMADLAAYFSSQNGVQNKW